MEKQTSNKPLGKRSYGSIGHFPTSRLGEGDHKISDGQYLICTEKARDKHDVIIVQEKLDGSNVGVCRVNGELFALTRAGYEAKTSPFEMHHKFHDWVEENKSRFDWLEDGERICGEWLIQAHGTRYKLPHEPIVFFDVMRGDMRLPYCQFLHRIRKGHFITPRLISYGPPAGLDWVLKRLEPSGHGALEPIEGAVWRVERKGEVDFLGKYVRPDKIDGSYLIDRNTEEKTQLPPTWNEWQQDSVQELNQNKVSP